MGAQDPSHEPTSPPRRVLVTGGAGFIGSHLVDTLLTRADEITVVDNLSTGHLSNLAHCADRIRFIESSVSSALPALSSERFDEIYHLAAAVGVELVLQDPVGSIHTNVSETYEVLRYAASLGSCSVLIASSSEVYGKPGTSVFSEDDDLLLGSTETTRWSYAHAKALDEHLAMGFHTQHGLDTVCCRFFNTVGPRQVGRYGMVLPRFVQAAHEGAPLRVFGDGTQTRCFCDGRDVANTLPQLLRSGGRAHRVYNIGSDRPISIRDLGELVISTLGSSSALELIPYDKAYPAGFEDLRHRKPDLDRIRGAVGFAPRFTLAQTIRDLHSTMRSADQIRGGVS